MPMCFSSVDEKMIRSIIAFCLNCRDIGLLQEPKRLYMDCIFDNNLHVFFESEIIDVDNKAEELVSICKDKNDLDREKKIIIALKGGAITLKEILITQGVFKKI